MADPVRDFKLTEDGEWYVNGGAFETVAGQEAVTQGARVRLRMFLGECYLDESVGVDYLGSILVKNPDELLIRAVLAERLASVPDVTGVFGAELVREEGTRDASISFQIDSAYSEQPFTQTVDIGNV